MPAFSDSAAPRSEDRLLLDETHHRVINEIAAATAAMRIARSMESGAGRERLIDNAVSRLDGFGECYRLLAATSSGNVDLGDMLDRMCRNLIRARPSEGPDRVVLDLCRASVDHEMARRICLVAHELITNSLKHAFNQEGQVLQVHLKETDRGMTLTVVDDGPGIRRCSGSDPSGSRLGRGLVGELVRRAGGSIETETGPGGTEVRVSFPVDVTDEPPF